MGDAAVKMGLKPDTTRIKTRLIKAISDAIDVSLNIAPRTIR